MQKKCPLNLFVLMTACALALTASAQEKEGTETGLDLSLRTKAAEMKVNTLDGSAMETPASHMVLLDEATGAVLASKAADQKMYPSSMTKMMTLYILFDRLKKGTIALDSQFTVSEKAWNMQGSKMFVPLGGQVSVQDLIRGIAVQSGNDACIVVAEAIAGSEEAFVNIMNSTAKALGMTHTQFTDASGWPHPDHTTTPQDLIALTHALIRDFPEEYKYFSEREFTYNGIRQFNRNLLLGDALGVDGLKTGHTEAAGYGIALSAKEPGTQRRLSLIINGLSSESARAQEGKRLLTWGFANFSNARVFNAGGEVYKAKVWMGKERELVLTTASDIVVTLPKSGGSDIKASVTYSSPLMAPITQGQEVGTLTLTTTKGEQRQVPLVAATDNPQLSRIGRMLRALGL